MPRGAELLNERRCQDDHIARRTFQQLLFHHAHGIEGARELRVGGLFNGGLERGDQALCCATTQQMNKTCQSINPI
jgi:hypothetical protein